MNYKAAALDALETGINVHNDERAAHYLARAQVYATLAVLELLETPTIEGSLSVDELKRELGL